MAYFPEVALPDSFPPFVALRESLGFLPGLFRAQSALPRALEVEAAIAGALLFGEGALDRLTKERMLLSLAADFGSTYCVTAHARILGELGVEENELSGLLANGARLDLPREERGLLEFSRKLGLEPVAFSESDHEGLRALGFADEAILETVLVTALTRFLCTLATGTGAQPDFAPRTFSRAAREVARKDAIPRPKRRTPYLRAPVLSPDDFAPFALLRERFGFVPNIFQAQTLRPDVLAAEAQTVDKVLLSEDLLSRRQKEFVLLVISAANLNTYCVAVHCEMLRGLGLPEEESDRIALDHRSAPLVEADRHLLDFAWKLTQKSSEFGRADVDRLRAAGFPDAAVLEAVVMSALTEFLNTVQVGLGPPVDFEPRLVFLPETGGIPNPARASGRPEDREDGDLVRRTRGGDADAFAALYRRHWRRVARVLVGIAGGTEDVEDAVQEVFLKAYEHLAELRGRTSFRSWLSRIAVNEGIRRLRARRDQASLDAFDAEGEDGEPLPREVVEAWAEDAERKLGERELREVVEGALLRLAPRYRLPVVLRDLEGMSGEDAARALGLPLPTLKTRLLRGRLRLRDELSRAFRTGAAR